MYRDMRTAAANEVFWIISIECGHSFARKEGPKPREKIEGEQKSFKALYPSTISLFLDNELYLESNLNSAGDRKTGGLKCYVILFEIEQAKRTFIDCVRHNSLRSNDKFIMEQF